MKLGRSVVSLNCKDGLAFRTFLPAAFALVMCALQGGVPLAAAPTLHTAYTFYSGPGGACPNGKVLLVSPSLAFGTTYYGGDNNYGIVYELTWDGAAFSETVLYSFTGGADGGNPTAGLYMDASGALYGTASTSNGAPIGTVFKLAPAAGGTYTFSVIHSFGTAGDGANPNSNLVASKNGVLYGTTVNGGASGEGTVFSLTPVNGEWFESVIYSFTGGPDGAQPYAGISADSADNLYGAAYVGGTSDSGTVFELLPPTKKGGSWTEKTLYSFTGGIDGLNPLSGVTLNSVGDLLGTTYLGGTSNAGVIFDLVKSKGYAETVLVSFDGTNGANPSDSLVPDNAGDFYGSTGAAEFYGPTGGNIFKIVPTPNGLEPYALYSVYTFTGGVDGQAALPSVSQTIKGALFGTTFYGGYGGAGSVFEIY